MAAVVSQWRSHRLGELDVMGESERPSMRHWCNPEMIEMTEQEPEWPLCTELTRRS